MVRAGINSVKKVWNKVGWYLDNCTGGKVTFGEKFGKLFISNDGEGGYA